MPKFTLESDMNLNEVLMQIGLVEGFIPDSADFNGIGERQLYISDVRQKAKIEVCKL